MTTCLAHPDRASVATCSACGADLCSACHVQAHERAWCEACFTARHAAPSAPPPLGGATIPLPRRLKSPGLAAILSLLAPGLGTVYAFSAPVARGLVQFAAWAVLLWTVQAAEGLLAFLLFFGWVGFYLWQAVDAHASAALVNSLGRVPTEAELEAMGRGGILVRSGNARSLGIALLVVGCVLLLAESGGILVDAARRLAPFVLIGLGAWVIWRARRTPTAAAPPAGGPA